MASLFREPVMGDACSIPCSKASYHKGYGAALELLVIALKQRHSGRRWPVHGTCCHPGSASQVVRAFVHRDGENRMDTSNSDRAMAFSTHDGSLSAPCWHELDVLWPQEDAICGSCGAPDGDGV